MDRDSDKVLSGEGTIFFRVLVHTSKKLNYVFEEYIFPLLKSWVTLNFITIKTSWNAKD
jgi:hypothetical protein